MFLKPEAYDSHIKETVHPKMKIQSLSMQMESQGKFFSQQNVSGAWQKISAAAFSWTTEVDGD